MEKTTFESYQRQANGFLSDKAKENPLLNAALGLCGESGEFADLIKKHLFQGHDLNQDDLIKELGDVLWYIAEACLALDIPLEKVADRNIEKLTNRFGGTTFDTEKSIHRKKEKQ